MVSRSFKNLLSVALVAIISNSLLTGASYLLVEISSPEEPSEPRIPIPLPAEPEFPEVPKPDEPGPKPQVGVDYNPDPKQVANLRNLGGRQCRPQPQCARIKDPNRSIAARDDDLTTRGSRAFAYSCCYRYWWGGYYYCQWSSWYCNWWG